MFCVIVSDEIRKRHISMRQAAREIGIAHTTLIRASEGKQVDLPTINKICTWIGISPEKMLNIVSKQSENLDQDKFIALLERYPALRDRLYETAAKIENGTLEPDVVKDLLNFIQYRINQE